MAHVQDPPSSLWSSAYDNFLNAKALKISVNDASDFSSFKYYINENDYYEYIFSSAGVIYRKYINSAETGIWRIAGDEY